jgi:hypothetical protein
LSCFIYRVYTNVLWPCMEKKDRGKGGWWDPLSWRRESYRSRRGGLGTGALRRRWWWGQRTWRCRASGEARERGERDEERVGDADAMVHDKLKRGSWDGYKMDKI